MIAPLIPDNDEQRIAELDSYKIVGITKQEEFDFLVNMAAQICGTPISLITLITKDKQWFLSSCGISGDQSSREDSFCGHTINTPEDVFIVEDSRTDIRFCDNPYVTGEPHVIFYAGIPLVNENGYALGSLCVIDSQPKKISEEKIDLLRKLARQTVMLLELRRKNLENKLITDKLLKNNTLLKETQRINKLGSWEMELKTGRTIWTEQVYQIHEVPLDFDHNKDNGIEFYHPEDRPVIKRAIENTIKTKTPFDVTCRLITAKNNLKWVRASGIFTANEFGEDILIGSFQDITADKENAEKFELTQLRYQHILEGTNVGTWEWNVQTGETIFNERWAEIVGYTLDELQPISIETWIKLAHPDDLEESGNRLNRCFEGKTEYYEFEARMLHKNGHWVWVFDRGKVFSWTDDCKPLMMYGTHQDITERKKIEEELKISEQAFRGNFENAAIGMALLNEQGRWLRVNKRLCEIVGYSEEELKSLTFQDITYPDDLQSDLDLLSEIIAGKRNHYQLEKRYFHKNGHIVYIILGVSMVKNEEGQILYFISQIIDITELKLAEQKLSATLAKNQALLNASTQVAIISADCNGLIREFNTGAEQLLGYTAEELLWKHTPKIIHTEEEISRESDILFKEYNERVEGFEVFVYRAKKGIPHTREWTYIRKDGSTFPVLLSITAVKQNNAIVGYLGVATDISLLKKAEAEIKSLLGITKEQNERLKNFAHIVSHNLRSHSGGITGLMELLEIENPEYFNNELLQLLAKGTDSLRQTIEDLTEVVKVNLTNEGFEKVNIYKTVQKNIDSLLPIIKKENINISNQIPEQFCVSGISAYIDSIVLNFITNAIKYRSPERQANIIISAQEADQYAEISFQDNGLGIDLMKHGDQLFGMYKTFHKHEDSRGVGLFITKNQLESMGGKVEVESELNKGTTFKIKLPYEKS